MNFRPSILISFMISFLVTLLGVFSILAAGEFELPLTEKYWKIEGRQDTQASSIAGVLIDDDHQPVFFKNKPGALPTGSIHRTLNLRDLREVRVRFALDEKPLAGMGMRLYADKAHYTVLVAEEGRFVLSAQPPFYGGPSWRPGQEYEVRIAIDQGMLRTSVAAAGRLPVPIDQYTRPLPQAWKDKNELELEIGFLSKQRPERGDAAGIATLLAVQRYATNDKIPEDVQVSKSLEASLAKFDRLSAGTLTPPLSQWVSRQSTHKTASPPLSERFEVQAWDGSKIGRLLSWEDQTVAEIARYYTLLQFRGASPDRKLIHSMAHHRLRLASYQSTRQPAYYKALANSPDVLTQVLIKGKPQARANRFSGDLVELASEQTLLSLESAWKTGILKRVMIDSEHKTGIGLDPLSLMAAKRKGIDQLFVKPPKSKGPYQRILAEDDPRWQSLKWYFQGHHTDNDFHRPIAQAIHKAWPGVEVTTDPILDYGSTEQFAGLDAIQHWIRVHYAPRNPRSVAYYCERSWVHVRRGQGKPRIVIGPQLGRGERATPPDMLSEACWLAVAFGAKGITHWGQQAIWQPEGKFSPGGEATWKRMKRLRDELYNPHEDLFRSWKPRPRRVAMLYSLADLAYESGGRHTGREACENMYRALLSLGEPVDVIYDEEILSGRLDQYRALVVPSLYVANKTLVEKIASFAEKGGRVITHNDSVVANVDNVRTLNQNLVPIYRDYAITKGEPTLLPHEYAQFLGQLAGSVRSLLPFTPRVEMDRSDVIANLMDSEHQTFLVLVNDRRRYGPEVAALGHQYMLDQGVSNRVSFEFSNASELLDISTGKVIKPSAEGRFQVSLEPGWGAILRVVPSR